MTQTQTKPTNGKADKYDLGVAAPSLPDPTHNPFFLPAFSQGPPPQVTLPQPPGVPNQLTKEQVKVWQAGQTQLMKQYIQLVKGDFALRADARVEDVANSLFVSLGNRAMGRMHGVGVHPDLVPYLAMFTDGQLRRAGQEMQQIASTHARTQHDLVEAPIEIDEDSLKNFFHKLASGYFRR